MANKKVESKTQIQMGEREGYIVKKPIEEVIEAYYNLELIEVETDKTVAKKMYVNLSRATAIIDISE